MRGCSSHLTTSRVRTVAYPAALVLLVASAGCGGEDNATGPAEATTAPTSTAAEPAPEPAPVAGEDCLQRVDHAESVTFGAKGVLGGYVIGRGPRWVVLGHQSDGQSCQMLPIGRGLVEAGFHVLAVDFSGSGASIRSDDPDRALADDVVAAVTFAEGQGATKVATLGASMGGYAALGSAKELDDRVAAVVSLSAPEYFVDGGEPPDLKGLATPVLLYVGRGDIRFLSPNQAFAKADDAAELRILPTSDHGVDLVNSTVMGQIVGFLDRHL